MISATPDGTPPVTLFVTACNSRVVRRRIRGKSSTKNQLALELFEQPYVTSKTVQRLFDVKQPTASRVLNDLVDEGVLEEVTGKGRNKEYRAREIFESLEQPPQTY